MMELAAAASVGIPDVIVAVTGIKSATPLIGPIPGKTPTAVPINTPMKANIILCHCKAIWNPSIKNFSVSIVSLLSG